MNDQKDLTIIEWFLILALAIVIIVVIFAFLGPDLVELWEQIQLVFSA